MFYYSFLKLKEKNGIQNDGKISILINKNFSCNIKIGSEENFNDLQILKGLGTSFYKCPNGHIYAVGECGRPMEESLCPECNATIGGHNHIPARNNIAINIGEIENNDIYDNYDDEEITNALRIEQENQQPQEFDDEVLEYIANHPEANYDE